MFAWKPVIVSHSVPLCTTFQFLNCLFDIFCVGFQFVSQSYAHLFVDPAECLQVQRRKRILTPNIFQPQEDLFHWTFWSCSWELFFWWKEIFSFPKINVRWLKMNKAFFIIHNWTTDWRMKISIGPLKWNQLWNWAPVNKNK